MVILPINRDDYVGGRPYVVLGLVTANTLLLAVTYFLSFKVAFPLYGFVPAQPHILNLFSSMFLHGGVWHLAGNMFFLWMFGYRVENTFGRWLFGIVYLVCGLGAHALHYAFNSQSMIPCVGASGAISGIVGCYFVLFPKSRFDIEVFFFRFHVKTIPTRTHGALGAWIGEQTILGLLSQTVAFSSTAFWAHIGGFATGIAITSALLVVAPHLRIRGDQRFVVRAVKGLVLDANGEPIPDARFELRDDDSGQSRTATTSPQGRFSIPDIPEGCYSFTVSAADDLEPSEGHIVLSKAARYSVPIRIGMSARVRESTLWSSNQTPKVEIQTLFHGNSRDQDQI